MLKKSGIAAGALILTALLSSGTLLLADHNVIPYGTSINGVSVGGMTKIQAMELLSPVYASYENAPLVLRREKTEVRTTPKELGVEFPIAQVIDRAYLSAEHPGFARALIGKFRVLLRGERIALEAKINDDVFNSYVEKNLSRFERKTRNAALSYNQDIGVFQIAEGKTGNIIDRSALKYTIAKNANELSSDIITLSLQNDAPTITTAMLQNAQTQANTLLGKAPFLLLYNNKNTATSTTGLLAQDDRVYRVEKNQLSDFLAFIHEGNAVRMSTDDDVIRNTLVQLAPAINEKPRNATLTFKKGKVSTFALSQNGMELDAEKSFENIKGALLRGDNTASLAMNITLPEIRTDTIENMGLTALLGTGESNFAGSPSSRIANIKLGAEKLNGILIQPGQEFSTVNTLGDVDEKNGFQAALVIKGAKLIPEYGGGLCQVSTTLFRAAMYAGLKIIERFPHSLPVQYYNPQGFDAAIYGPHPDLRFVNDTTSPILIQTRIKGTKLFFELYGTADGREVKLIGPVEYDKKPNGSLKATLTREIYKEKQLVATNVFKSNYGSPHKDVIVKNPLE